MATNGYTAEEEARIQAEIDAYNKKRREQQLADEARNRILDEERKQPGKAGF